MLKEIKNGRYPPCICYQVYYTSAPERRKASAFWRAELHGADVKLSFTCRVTQEEGIPTHVSQCILCKQGKL